MGDLRFVITLFYYFGHSIFGITVLKFFICHSPGLSNIPPEVIATSLKYLCLHFRLSRPRPALES